MEDKLITEFIEAIHMTKEGAIRKSKTANPETIKKIIQCFLDEFEPMKITMKENSMVILMKNENN